MSMRMHDGTPRSRKGVWSETMYFTLSFLSRVNGCHPRDTPIREDLVRQRAAGRVAQEVRIDVQHHVLPADHVEDHGFSRPPHPSRG